MSDRVAVVGGGVIGLSTAVRLAEAGLPVTLLTGQTAERTTSNVAAAYWAPYWIGHYDRRWAETTLRELQSLALVPGTGVTIEPAEEWLTDDGRRELDAELEQAYWWRHLPGLQWRRTPADPPREMILPGRTEPILFTEKVLFRTAVARMPDYLAYLKDRFLRSAASRFEVRWVDSLETLLHDFGTVVHCTGWQAIYTVPEERQGSRPMRLLAGHVSRVPLLEGHPLVSLHRGPFREMSLYIVPRRGSENDMICGGTAIDTTFPEDRDVQLRGDTEICQTIMERCRAFEPRLIDVEVRENLLGLRPVRHAVRIESDPAQPRIIHNYGHGGAGLTLSWGSADRVLELMRKS
ncbi:MAG: FAD-dependent oxidoreductase [Pirellulaceae bacterium]